MTTTSTVEKLAQQLAAAEAKAAEARAEIERQEAEALAQRQERIDQFDLELARTWEAQEAELLEAEKAAYKRFQAAVLETPVFAAWIELTAGRERRRTLRDAAENAIMRVGLPDGVRRPAPLGYSQAQLVEDITLRSQEAVSDLVSEAMEAREQAREAAGDGA